MRIALASGIAATVAGLLTMVLARVLITDGELRALRGALAMPGHAISLDQVDTYVTTVWGWVLAATALVALGWLALLGATYRGIRWARIALTVAGGTWIVLSAPSLGGGMYGGAATAFATGITILLVVATLTALYLPTSRRFYAPARYEIHPEPPR